MIQILNLGNSLGVVKNGKLVGYTFSSIESITWEKDSVGYVVRITFIANHGCDTEALLIPLRDINNMPSWIDSVAGANLAVNDILAWINTASNIATLNIPVTIRTSASDPGISDIIFSISFANTGTANGLVNGEVLKPGEVVNYEGYFAAGTFSYDATGTEFLIIYIK